MNDDAAGAPHTVESYEPSDHPLRSDVQALIDAYRGLLAAPGDRAVARARRLRLALGLEHFLLERVRVGSETLQRRYALRASTGVAEEDEPERSRLRELTASLPPRPSRARLLLLAVSFLLAVRLLLSSIVLAVLVSFRAVEPQAEPSVPGDEVHAAIESLTRLDYTSVGRFFDVLVREGLLVSACVVASILAAAYLVLRPFAGGASLARALQDPEAAARRGRGGSLRQIAERLNVRAHERAAFGRLGIAPPGEPRFDLVVRALLPLAVLVLAVAMWRAGLGGVLFFSFQDSDAEGVSTTAATIVMRPTTPLAAAFAGACLAAARLGQLAREAWARPSASVLVAHIPECRRPAARRAASGAMVAAAAGVGTAVVLAAVWLHTERAPSVGVVLSSPLTTELADQRELTVDVWCDRPCYLEYVWLAEADGLTTPASLEDPYLTYDRLRAPSPAAFPVRFVLHEEAPRERLRLRFSEEQAEWLRDRLRPGRGNGAMLRLKAGGGQWCYLGPCWGGTTVVVGSDLRFR